MNIDPVVVRQQVQFVNEKLNAWDFIGVADLVDDEYDCMVGPLTRMLRARESNANLVDYLNDEIATHFGMADTVSPDEVTAVVADLVEAWLSRFDIGSDQRR